MNYYVRYLMYRHRYRLSRIYMTAVLLGLFLLLAAALGFLARAGLISRTLQGTNFTILGMATSWSERDPAGLIRSAAPVMAWGGDNEDYPEEITPTSLVTAMLAPFRVNFRNPADLIDKGVPALAEYRRGAAVPAAATAGGQAEAGPQTPVALSEDTLVGIYHTHTGETYALTDGVERLQGQKGGWWRQAGL